MTALDPPAGIANKISLEQNYPNPFNPKTVIRYSLPVNQSVTLKIYDIGGREVRTLVNTAQQSGNYTVEWDGLDDFGKAISGGIYLYKLSAGKYQHTRKMIYLK